jgi:eukaryotic-like serine/threonine-protein kinase
MSKANTTEDKIVQFLRKRDYVLVKELGQGACGKTVLLHDVQIDERFVCKKYVPHSETQRQELFTNFVREIKLLHKIHHQNIVRVFNYYLYPDQFTGFILMEFVNGKEVDDYLAQFPEQINEIFLQAIGGFSYLERKGILHRDIRPANVMVSDDGIVKIIDLGFGKEIHNSQDFKKSITLNWWCQPPSEFENSRYDFGSEVYFVGKLFEGIIQEHEINHFKYADMLGRMCQRNPKTRIKGFVEIEKEIGSNQFYEIGFTDEEIESYRAFADSLCNHITKIENGAKYAPDMTRIQTKLNDVYRNCMLEQWVPDVSTILLCFILGAFYYRQRNSQFPVVHLKDFVRLLTSSTDEKKRIILANLHTKLDAITRYSESAPTSDDVPF